MVAAGCAGQSVLDDGFLSELSRLSDGRVNNVSCAKSASFSLVESARASRSAHRICGRVAPWRFFDTGTVRRNGVL
jgi:hypothetical protein